MSRYVRLALIAALSIVAAGRVTQTLGANYSWSNASSGFWGAAGNWNPSTVPGPADTAFIGNGGTALIEFGIMANCNALVLGGAASGNVQLASGGSLAVGGGGEIIGNTGNGFFTQSDGTNSVASSMILGNSASTNGSYSLSGGSLAAGYVYVGNSGSGAFTQTGGTNSVTYNVFLGNNAGGSGSCSLSGNGYLTADEEYIGNSSSGAFTQSGGTNSMATGPSLGNNTGSSGSYNLSGGSLFAAIGEDVGYYGSGTFTQTGGTNSAQGGYVSVGSNVGSSGSFSLSGGYLTAGMEYVGNSGSGAFTQTGGTNSAQGGAVFVGSNVGSSGSYSLSGSGYLVAGDEYVGNYGSAAFLQSGGTNSVASALVLGQFSGNTDSYNLSGGTLAAAFEYVGSFGSGAFTQTGGTNSVTNNAYLGYFAGGSGSYNLSGSAYLAVPFEYVGNSGSGAFTQTGGTHSVSNTLIVGFNPGSSGFYNLSGSGYLVATYEVVGFYSSGAFTQTGGTNSVPHTLFLGQDTGGSGYLAAPTEYVGYSGSGAFTQSGGTNSAGNLTLGYTAGSSGSYNLSGSGYLTAGTISVGGLGGFSQSGGTIGPGKFLNAGTFSYNGGAFNGQLVNYGTCLFDASFYAAGGIVNYTAITVPPGLAIGTSGGSGTLDNEGTITLAGGTLAGGQTATTGGPILNNGLITGYGGLTSGVGITNNGQIYQSGGNLTIAGGTAGATNANTVVLAQGYQLLLSGSTLTNTGGINLNAGMIIGTGLLYNSRGNVSGPGTISAPLVNSGGVLSVPPGTTSITLAFANSGAIQLDGVTANLTGGSIANAGSIRGNGSVSNSINNTGTIEANGYLTLTGSVQNSAAGLISVDSASSLVIVGGLADNYGVINLTGGVFDNNGRLLANADQISGFGTLRTGGLSNSGDITFGGATTTVNGPVTNAGGGTLSVSYSPALFTGAVVNNGYFKITGTTVTYASSFTNNATYLSDPAVNYFSGLANDAGGLLKGGNGDQFFVTGPLLSNAGQIDLGGTSTMVVENGAGLLTQTSGTLEIGTGATLSAGTVAIDGGALLADGPGGTITADLVYGSSSTSTYQGILAGAGNWLTVNNASAKLVLSGSGDTYAAGTFVTSGELIVTSAGGIESGTALRVGSDLAAFGAIVPADIAAQPPTPVPEPGTLVLVAAGLAGMAIAARRRRARGKNLTTSKT